METIVNGMRRSLVGRFSKELEKKHVMTIVSPMRNVHVQSRYSNSAVAVLSPTTPLSASPNDEATKNRRPRYMQNTPKAITIGESASFSVAKLGLISGPSVFLTAEYIFAVRKVSAPIATTVCFGISIIHSNHGIERFLVCHFDDS